MGLMLKELEYSRENFGVDPFGYSAQAFYQFGVVKALHGIPVNFDAAPTSEDLKNPILWLAHAEALTQAAITLIKTEPKFENMPFEIRAICDSQYCAVTLMLIGYSLEISLKSMMIMSHGISGYIEIEKKHRHHRLHELSQFIPTLNRKEKAILRLLTHFVYWAGRYPDPGSGREDDATEIFELSETYRITGSDLLRLSAKVMQYTKQVVG
ncbi:hypothetical protein FLM11_17295 [Vibrio cholerae]|nr:hypothetical protein FLM11_17295 [Vibrio cholerae]